MMEIPLWLRVLIPLLILLLILIIIMHLFLAAVIRERRRGKLRANLLETRNKELTDRVEYLERLLSQAKVPTPPSLNKALMAGKKVFISYSSKDFDIAQDLQHLLADNYIPTFMAPASIPAGSNYTQEIPDAICDSFAMVVMISRTAQASQWVAKEINMALEENVPIIPYQIDEVKLNRQFRFMLAQCQYIQAHPNMDSATAELISRLKALQKEALSHT